MVKAKQAIFGIAAAAAIALLPMAPAVAGGHGIRPLHPFAIGHGLLGAAVALATLPLTIASSVVAGVSDSVAPYPSSGYGAPTIGYAPPAAYAVPRPYYPAYGAYHAPRVVYGSRGHYAPHPGYYGHGYYRAGGNSYPHR